MAAVDVEDVGESVLPLPLDVVVEREEEVGTEAAVLVKHNGLEIKIRKVL